MKTCVWVLFSLLHVIEKLPEGCKSLKRHEHFNPYKTYTIACNNLNSYSAFPPDLTKVLKHSAQCYCCFILVLPGS